MDSRAAIVTGTSSGIGRAIAMRLIAKGHNIGANARGEDRLTELEEWSRSQPGVVAAAPGDATQEETVNRLLRICFENFKVAPSIGVVNAGRIECAGRISPTPHAGYFNEGGRKYSAHLG